MEYILFGFFTAGAIVFFSYRLQAFEKQQDKQTLFIRRLEARIWYLEGGLTSAERDDLLKRLVE